MQKMGVDSDASGLITNIAKWFIRLIALVVAFDALGLPAVSDVLRQLLWWLPNLAVAMVVLVLVVAVAGLVANALSKLVRGATAQAGFSNPDTLASVVRVAVWAFAIVIAVNQIGVATTLVNNVANGNCRRARAGVWPGFRSRRQERGGPTVGRVESCRGGGRAS